jgi:anti-sigma regulatory factor (Ser/Thr protein kinase)
MQARLEIVIGNTLEEIPQVNERIGEWLIDAGADSRAVMFANLCVEEIVSNTIKYGFDDDDPHAITITIERDASKVLVEIRDEGRAFNPLTVPAANFSVPLEERPIGGLGLQMVKRIADGAEYSREAGVNRLMLWKSLA